MRGAWRGGRLQQRRGGTLTWARDALRRIPLQHGAEDSDRLLHQCQSLLCGAELHTERLMLRCITAST